MNIISFFCVLLVFKICKGSSFAQLKKRSWAAMPVAHHQHNSYANVPPLPPSIRSPFSKIRQGLKLETNDKTYSVETSNFHTPIISHHKNGATVGLHLPDSDLRLLVDIDNTASKPVAQHIGLKVVELQPVQKYLTPIGKEHPVQSKLPLPPPPSHFKGSYPVSQTSPLQPPSEYKSSLKVPLSKNFKIGYIKASDLHSAINQRIINQMRTPQDVRAKLLSPYLGGNQIDYPTYFNYDNGYSQPVNTGYQTGVKGYEPFPHQGQVQLPIPDINQGGFKPISNYSMELVNEIKDNTNGGSKGGSKGGSNGGNNFTTQSIIEDKVMNMTHASKTFRRKATLKKPFYATIEPMIEQLHIQDEEPETHTDSSLSMMTQTPQVTSELGHQDEKEDMPVTTEAGVTKMVPDSEDLVSEEVDDEAEDNVSKEGNEEENEEIGDNAKIEFNDEEEEGLNASPTSFFDVIDYCAQSCKTLTDQMTKVSSKTTLESLAASLNANDIISAIPSVRDVIQSIIDFAPSGYTLILPSNEAIARLPQTLVNSWLSSPSELKNLIEHHFIENSQTLEQLNRAKIINPRASGSTLRISTFRNETYTINGQRVIFGNQKGPNHGIIHVIDGVLYPYSNKNIMKILRTCTKCDGFVTLADGTGLSKILSMRKFYNYNCFKVPKVCSYFD